MASPVIEFDAIGISYVVMFQIFVVSLLNFKSKGKFQGSTVVPVSFLCVFLVLVWLNLIRLTPYRIRYRSYPVITLMIGLTMWVYFVGAVQLMKSKNHVIRTMQQMTPLSTPRFLLIVMPVLELVSLLLQPCTLIVRITANLSVGHTLVGLTGNLPFVMSFIMTLGVLMFEVAVAVIQTVVFCLLLSIYKSHLKG